MSSQIRVNDRRVYHFTPIEQLPEILNRGLLAVNEQRRLGIQRRPLLWRAAQAYREEFQIPVGPHGTALDYVPLYFTRRNQMLLALISNKVVDEEQIVHLELSLDVAQRYPSVFTDGPILPGSSPRFFDQFDQMDALDWETLDSPAAVIPRYNLRRPELSELLVYRSIPAVEIRRVIVWNYEYAERVRLVYAQACMNPPPVQVDLDYYYLDPDAPEPYPAIHGPVLLRDRVNRSLENIDRRRTRRTHFRFMDLAHLLSSLQQDLSALPETAELVGLETDNRSHFEDVGAHTLHVVEALLETEEYRRLEANDRLLAEVAAYLHDIGKGPKSRWEHLGGKQQIDMDHPVKALPMLERILGEDIADISVEEIDRLCRTVVYHDLIGGIMVSNRRLSELFDVVRDRRELDIFFALSRADALAINPAWEHPEERERLYQHILARQPEGWSAAI